METEIDIGKFCRVTKAVHLKDLLLNYTVTIGENLADIPAYHHFDQLRFADIFNQTVCNEMAISIYCVSVGDPENFIKFMAYEENSLSLRLQLFDKFV